MFERDINLIVIAPFYRWFIKELVEAQSKEINKQRGELLSSFGVNYIWKVS